MNRATPPATPTPSDPSDIDTVPGDDEWTDCDRPATKGPTYDTVERLGYERSVFYRYDAATGTSTDRSLGQRTISVTRQSDVDPACPSRAASSRRPCSARTPPSRPPPTPRRASPTPAMRSPGSRSPSAVRSHTSTVTATRSNVDKPFTDQAGHVIENVTRVTRFGSAQNHWVFALRQHVIAANVPAYVAP